jgi:hypothetical protein
MVGNQLDVVHDSPRILEGIAVDLLQNIVRLRSVVFAIDKMEGIVDVAGMDFFALHEFSGEPELGKNIFDLIINQRNSPPDIFQPKQYIRSN